MNISFDLITGLAGSGRLAFAEAFKETQDNTRILFSAATVLAKSKSAQQQTLSAFSNFVFPKLVRDRNIVFVTDLCEDLCTAEGVIDEIQRSIVTHCRTPVVMNVIHIMPPEPTVCIEELQRRGKPITDHSLQKIQKGFDLFRKHGPCFPHDETLVLPPLSPSNGTVGDAVEALTLAKSERNRIVPRELVLSSNGEWIEAVTQPPIGITLQPTHRAAGRRKQKPANTDTSSPSTLHY